MNFKDIIGRNKTIIELQLQTLILSKRKEGKAQKFLVIARSRTGSTMLIKYLKKVRGAYVKGEMMGRKRWICAWSKIPELFYEQPIKYNLIRFKVFYYHPIDDYNAINHIYKYVMKHPEIKVLHWMREDLLAVILSRYIAGKTKAYSQGKKGRKLMDFNIDETGFRCELERTLTQQKMIQNLFVNYKNYKEFTFEDIVDRGRLNNVFNFLEVDGGGIHHQSKTRQHSESKYEHIRNIAGIKAIYDERMKMV